MPKVLEQIWEAFGPLMSIMTEYFVSKGYKNPMAMTRYLAAVMDGVQLHIMIDPETFPAEEVKKFLIKQFA